MKLSYVPALAAMLTGSVISLAAQQPAASPAPAANDPFLKGGAAAPAAVPAPGPGREPEKVVQLLHQGLVRLEYISLPHTLARKMVHQYPQQQALYDALGEALEKEGGEVKLEHLTLLKIRGGQRSKTEEINEYPYPTEFDPPQIPQSIGIGVPLTVNTNNNSTTVTPPAAPAPVPPKPGSKPNPNPASAPAPAPNPTSAPPPGAEGPPGVPGTEGPAATIRPGSVPATHVSGPWPYTTTTGSAFTFRNTGWTLEAELIVGEDGFTVDVNMAPEHVKLIRLIPQSSNGEIVQPLFETNKLVTQIQTVINRPTLVGTISPPVGAGPAGTNTVNRTWLVFLTVTKPR